VITNSNSLYQLDVIGPRYLKEDGRFYSVNIIDAYDRLNTIKPERRQNRIAVTKGLLSSCKTLGIPIYEQMDKKLPLQGSNYYPTFLKWLFVSVFIWVYDLFLFLWLNLRGMRLSNIFKIYLIRCSFVPNILKTLLIFAGKLKTLKNITIRIIIIVLYEV